MAGGTIDGQGHPVSSGLGVEPSAPPLHRRHPADLVQQRNRRRRRGTDPDAIRQRGVRRNRSRLHVPAGVGDHPPQPPTRIARSCAGGVGPPGARHLLAGVERRAGVRSWHRSGVGRRQVSSPYRRARQPRSCVACRDVGRRVRCACRHDAGCDRRGRRGRAPLLHEVGTVGARPSATCRADRAGRARTGDRGVRVVLRTKRGALRRHRCIAVPARDVPTHAPGIGARHDPSLVDVVERLRGLDVAHHTPPDRATRVSCDHPDRGGRCGHGVRCRPSRSSGVVVHR